MSPGQGEPVCPDCGCCEAYKITTRRKFKCKACHRQFSVTSGTIFASRKMAFVDLLAAICITINASKGWVQRETWCACYIRPTISSKKSSAPCNGPWVNLTNHIIYNSLPDVARVQSRHCTPLTPRRPSPTLPRPATGRPGLPPQVSALAPLRHPTFRRFWAASQVSNFGGLVQTVGAAWLMTSLTTSPTMIALVQTSNALPIMLFSLSAGALADNYDRRKIMLIAQGMMLAASVVLVAATFGGILTPWSLLAFTFLIGLGTALNNPSWQASLGDIVPREHLPEAVSLNSMGFNMMRSIGPALGGFIVATLGAAVAFAVNAVSYVPILAALVLWKPATPRSPIPRESFGPAVAAGLRYVAMSPNLLRVMLRGGLFGLGAISVLALLPLVARDLVQGGALTYGVLLGCFGFGAVGGGLMNAPLRQRLSNETLVRGAFTGYGLGALILSQSHSLWFSLPAVMVTGACWVVALSLFNVTVQLSSPRWVVGRALAMYQMATFGGMAVGSWIWGALADRLDTEGALTGAALCLFLGGAIGLWAVLPEFGKVDLDPLDRFREPALLLDLRGRSGPVMVMIDYQIDAGDIPEFLTVMTERRRIRRRDGARQWVLLRDLEHPELWIESYHVATWDDYLRHNMRRTKADAEVSDRINALHRGAAPPRVHRMIERQSVASHGEVPLKGSPDHI
jgi:MFS family permease